MTTPGQPQTPSGIQSCETSKQLRVLVDRILTERGPLNGEDIFDKAYELIQSNKMPMIDLAYLVGEVEKGRQDIDPQIGAQYDDGLRGLLFLFDLCGGRGEKAMREAQKMFNECKPAIPDPAD